MQRLTHEARILVVFNRDRLAHDCGGIEGGVFAKRDGNRCQLATGSPIPMKVFLRDQSRTGTGRGHAVHRVFTVPTPAFARAFTVPCSAHHWFTETREAD